MSDLMTFPDTVEEFMEEYKIIDTEQVYTNGAELVPIFRMKQWFEHLQTVGCEYWDMESNYCALYRPTAEKKGKWLMVEDTDEDGNARYECSLCHAGETHTPMVKVSYCWNCGARMEKSDG